MRDCNPALNVEVKQRQDVDVAAQTSHVQSVVVRVASTRVHVVEPELLPALVLAAGSPNAPMHRISFEVPCLENSNAVKRSHTM